MMDAGLDDGVIRAVLVQTMMDAGLDDGVIRAVLMQTMMDAGLDDGVIRAVLMQECTDMDDRPSEFEEDFCLFYSEDMVLQLRKGVTPDVLCEVIGLCYSP
ncbi:hypothetical protein KIPB_011401 [Kipferlia bialata]|uniref:Uncharacterized protein n=1 Tax=Kipferlia bialata TaxID=797122 RepID=A0A9K3GNR2_9EUKA|nr:hypothetical protein KIPB_011401 [Kipferlia bialata]|eukprot:g11401.t1